VKISIITPSFNQDKYIKSTLESVLNQKGDFDLQLIVIDGGSTDNSLNILNKYSNKITLISEKDEGQSDALNKGLMMAEGEIIGWLNSDDIYYPNALQSVCTRFAKNKNTEWVYGKCNIINEKGVEIRKNITAYKNHRMRKFSYNKLLHENFISQPAVFFRKELLLNTGFVDKGLRYTMDYDLWLRLAKISKPEFIPIYLAGFRRHNDSKSENNYKDQFQEQYIVMGKNSNSRYHKIIHKILNFRTVATYNCLNIFKK